MIGNKVVPGEEEETVKDIGKDKCRGWARDILNRGFRKRNRFSGFTTKTAHNDSRGIYVLLSCYEYSRVDSEEAAWSFEQNTDT